MINNNNNKRNKRLKAGDKDYVSNSKLFAALVEYRNAKFVDPSVQPSDYIVYAIMLICQRRLNSYNFSQYDFKDEMLSDAYLDCFRDLTKFNPEVSDNPFSYFTQIANIAYIRRIKLEKQQLYTKYTLIDETILFEDDGANIQEYGNKEEQAKKNDFMEKYEKSLIESKEKMKLKKLEKNNKNKKSLL